MTETARVLTRLIYGSDID